MLVFLNHGYMNKQYFVVILNNSTKLPIYIYFWDKYTLKIFALVLINDNY